MSAVDATPTTAGARAGADGDAHGRAAGASFEELEAAARRVRESIVRTTHVASGAHVGGALSQADLLVALYHRYLRVRVDDPAWPDRDRFVLSKGHGRIGLVATLADRGFFTADRVAGYGAEGALCVNMSAVPGIEHATGSLGHGPAVAVGLAVGLRLQGRMARTVCLVSDGELYEGSVWEAINAAAAFRCGHLTLVIDRNRLTMDGDTEAHVPLEPIDERLRAFGWDAVRCDGHAWASLCGALDRAWAAGARDRPTAIVAETVKGRGVDFMEGHPSWHYGSLDSDGLVRALASLDRYHAARSPR
jgi:transketolase